MNDSLLTGRQRHELEELFSLFDSSGNGQIGSNELATVMRSLGQNLTEAELQDMINDVDTDGSGQLDLPEFMNLMTSRFKDTDTTEEFTRAFKVFDVDHDGIITLDNL